MAVDLKYGKVWLEHGTIGEYEPVVVFRANDRLLPKVLMYYNQLCLREGSPKRHLDLILSSRSKVIRWQSLNGSRIPNSEASREWLDKAENTSNE